MRSLCCPASPEFIRRLFITNGAPQPGTKLERGTHSARQGHRRHPETGERAWTRSCGGINRFPRPQELAIVGARRPNLGNFVLQE